MLTLIKECTFYHRWVHMMSARCLPWLLALLLYMAFLATCVVVLAGVEVSAERKPLVVTTTTVLGSVVKDLAGDSVVVEVIASPAVCPAHYDVKPSDVDAFKRADLVLSHGVEPWVSALKEASGSSALVVVVKGEWNTPPALRELYKAVAKTLEENLGINVSDRLQASLKAIDELEEWLKSLALEKGFAGKPVVTMKWQRPLLEYLGFKVVAVYNPPEMVTAREYEEVVVNATRENALLVVDNLQSGTELGESLAQRIGAVHVVLTNFPGIQPGVNNVTDMIKYNALQLAKALDEAETRAELLRTRSEVEFWRGLSTGLGSLAAVLAVSTTVLAVKVRRLRGG